eukprot:TRINITY_DN1421_c2_g1_i1.p1 TRINITY_DN1421_c2_g1~~TRINITY_DN1421_c2_g1_i1.p1  ORF type:complete len:118 (-),score=13.35 TRINITY_DN1421_c2_g1_i1:104-421(-)
MAGARGQDTNMNADMKPEMVEEVKKIVQSAFDECNKERDIATFIKKQMEKSSRDPKFGGQGGVWHCVVGRNFGSFVTHESKAYVYFYHNQWAILLWKSISTYAEQ